MATKKQKILITGASGTIGVEILKRLHENGNAEVYAFDISNRRTDKILHQFTPVIRIISGNLTKSADISLIPSGLNFVIHLAAIIPPLADKKPELADQVNVMGTRLLIKYLEETSPDCHFLFSSSVAVYGDRITNPEIRVGDPLRGSEGDVYARSKIACEAMIRESKLNWTIFRLTAIMKNHKVSPIMFHMPLSTIMEICTPGDTANAFIRSMEKSEVTHHIYNLGGGEVCRISFRDFLERSFQIYGLGHANFPEHAFAEKNFHCGIYADGDILEEILQFRHDSIETYFEVTKKTLSPWIRALAIIFRHPVKWYLLSGSEPYRAYKTNNKSQIAHFFLPVIHLKTEKI